MLKLPEKMRKLLITSVSTERRSPFRRRGGKLFARFDAISVREVKGNKNRFEFVLHFEGEETFQVPLNSPVYFRSGDTMTLNGIKGLIGIGLDEEFPNGQD